MNNIIDLRKKCTIESCDKKYHGKGYCNFHYNRLILKPQKDKIPCAVEGCEKSVCIESGKLFYCSAHFTRLKRNGDVLKLRNERNSDWANLSEIDRFNYVFKNRADLFKKAREVFKNSCSICGWDKGSCDVHHIIPVSKGGSHSLSNVKILCPNCHRETHHNEKLS